MKSKFQIGVPVFLDPKLPPETLRLARTPVSVTYTAHSEDALRKQTAQRGLLLIELRG